MNIEEIKVRLSNLDAGKVVKYDNAMNLATQYMVDYKNDVEWLLSIIETAEKALEKSIIQMRNDGEAIAEEMGYKFTDCDVIKEVKSALQVIRGK